ncbi:MAG: vitamin K epoxide reductase, partial [Chryseolinea sp.]
FWCSVCLLTAVAMVVMIPLTLDEVVAMIQFIIKRTKEGKPFWRTFWMGDTIEGGGKDNRSPSFIGPLNKTVPSMLWGVNIPWNLLLSTAIGIGLMFTPFLFSIQKPFANHLTTIGALIVTFTVIAMAEVGRSLRFLNIAFALWIIVASFLVKDPSDNALWIAIASGVLLTGLSFRKGKISESYGTFDRYIV